MQYVEENSLFEDLFPKIVPPFLEMIKYNRSYMIVK